VQVSEDDLWSRPTHIHDEIITAYRANGDCCVQRKSGFQSMSQ